LFDCGGSGPASAWPQVPIHDAGMRAALALLDGTHLPSINLAWSPNGRRLAVTPSDIGAGGVAAASVTAPALTVYDCASGRVRLQLSHADLVPTQSGGQPFLAPWWSPDGTYLLLVSLGRQPHIQVLGPTSLGS
jgi:Tol biopolymer transport system component